MPNPHDSRSRSRSRRSRRPPASDPQRTRLTSRRDVAVPRRSRRSGSPSRRPRSVHSNPSTIHSRRTTDQASAAPFTAAPKKALPQYIVRTREIPGTYDYNVEVDGVSYKVCSAFYCTVCHAQLHSGSIDMHIGTKKHKGKLNSTQDDEWEGSEQSQPALQFAGSSSQPLSQFQAAGYLTNAPPSLPLAPLIKPPQPIPPAMSPPPIGLQPPIAIVQTLTAIAPPAIPPALPPTIPPAAPPPPIAPIHIDHVVPAAAILFPPAPLMPSPWTDEQINSLFASAIFRARLEEFVANRLRPVFRPVTNPQTPTPRPITSQQTPTPPPPRR